MSDWLPDSKLLIFQRYTSSLVTVPRLSHFVLASHISSLGCHLPRPTSHSSGPPVQGLSKWSWPSSSAIVVAAYSMGARHLRVSDVPESEQVFLTLLEVAGWTFSWEVRRSKCSRCSPPREDIYLSGFWPLATLRAIKVIILSRWTWVLVIQEFCRGHHGHHRPTNSWNFDLHQTGLQVFLEAHAGVVSIV
jgi:hypothetical protein